MPLLTKNHFLLMFDPHRTRYNDRRYFTKKGQVIQARKVNPPFSIENDKIDAYKKYLIKNHLIESTIPTIDSFQFSDELLPHRISEMTLSTQDTSVAGRNQVLWIGTSQTNPNFWVVCLVYLNNSISTYTIPSGVRYMIFPGNGFVNDVFQFFSGGVVIMELAQRYEDDPSAQKTYVTSHGFNKSLVNFSNVPA